MLCCRTKTHTLVSLTNQQPQVLSPGKLNFRRGPLGNFPEVDNTSARRRGLLCTCRDSRDRLSSLETTEGSTKQEKIIGAGTMLPCGCTACAAQMRSRNGLHDKFLAFAMDRLMGRYEAMLSPVKAQLFGEALGGAGKGAQDILEIGIGTAPNLKYYPTLEGIRLTAVEPNLAMEQYARRNAAAAGLDGDRLKLLQGVAEEIPLDDNSVDAVVGTLVMCSVPDVPRALEEIKRVLRPGGKYVFLEHVAAPRGSFTRLAQNVLNPAQMFIADGCHLNRETGLTIEAAEFEEVDMRRFTVQELMILGPHVSGIATAPREA
uniref:Methyltransferase-like protein 7a-like n=1 Tax=Tetraselmis sp. GSL018 TaxID=582737 RepID=A0A061RUX4_9CHLO